MLALPYGGGGNIRAYARGFAEAGAGAPALVARRGGGAADDARVRDPHRRIRRTPRRPQRLCASRVASVVSLADEAILQAWRDLAREEGVLCEPSSAAGLAALVEAGVEPGARVVCVLTGHGLKDSETAARESAAPVVVDADPDAIAEAAS